MPELLDVGVTPTGVATIALPPTPDAHSESSRTGVVSPTVGDERSSSDFDFDGTGNLATVTPSEGLTVAEGHTPSEADTPAGGEAIDLIPSTRAESAGVTTTGALRTSEGETPPETAKPPVAETPTDDSGSKAVNLRPSSAAEPVPAGASPSEGVTPAGTGSPTVGATITGSSIIPSLSAEPNLRPTEPSVIGPLPRTFPVARARQFADHEQPVQARRALHRTMPGQRSGAWWTDSSGTAYEPKRVQTVVSAQHSMSLGEERVYETLWHGREIDGVVSEGKRSKTFSLGYDRIARLVRLNEKSVRMLLPRLISKRILEVVAPENSANRIGRTYRIFSYEEILERQHNAGLTHVVKNGRAVEFVWPIEGFTPTVGGSPSAGYTVDETRAEPSPPSAVPQDTNSRYPAELAPIIRAMLPSFDNEALASLWAKCVQTAPDCSPDEVEYCFRLKAQQLLGRNRKGTNPVGLMLWAVPKCLEGPDALHLIYREQKRAREELQRQAEQEFQRQMEEWRRLVDDPNTNPEDRAFYQSLLSHS